MRTIAHLSDLHFGREDPAAVEALAGDLEALGPSLVAVSGDLTQRARRAEFQRARAFLSRLPAPRLVVPGNHDVPLFDVLRRFAAPLARFRAAMSQDLDPVFADDELLVIGVSTARSLTWKGGRISWAQMRRIRELAGAPHPRRLTVLVAHHPFSVAGDGLRTPIVGRAAHALDAFAGCGLDVILTGHLHRTALRGIEAPARAAHRTVLALHAGTAVSRRRRGEENAYNLLRFEGDELTVEVRSLRDDRFVPSPPVRFVRTAAGWCAAASAPSARAPAPSP